MCADSTAEIFPEPVEVKEASSDDSPFLERFYTKSINHRSPKDT